MKSTLRIIPTLTFICICALLPALSQAQIMFERTYGGSGDEYGSTCIQTTDGGYIVTRSTDSYGLGGFDIYVIRTNKYGDTLWTRTYGGSGNDLAISFIQSFDGNYVISGYTESYSADRDIYCTKINIDGDTVWTKIYNRLGTDNCSSIIECDDHGLFLVGSTTNTLSGYWDAYCIKTNSSGDTL